MRDVRDGIGPFVVVEGEARGADIISRECAKELGLTFLPFPAKWTTYGNPAGPIRNRQMVKEAHPVAVIAFHNHIATSTGTKDMVIHAQNKGLLTWVSADGMVLFQRLVLELREMI